MPERPIPAGSVAFRQDEVFWRGLFDIHLDPLAFIDANYRIVRANLALAQALGCRQEEVAGRYCYELFHGGDCPAEGCPHSRLLADGCEHAWETTLERLGGSYWISVTPVFDNTGVLVGCLHIARNVTAYKKLESELRAARNEVEARAELRTLELGEHLKFEQVLVSLALNLGKTLADADVKALIQKSVEDICSTGRFSRCVFWKVERASRPRAGPLRRPRPRAAGVAGRGGCRNGGLAFCRARRLRGVGDGRRRCGALLGLRQAALARRHRIRPGG